MADLSKCMTSTSQQVHPTTAKVSLSKTIKTRKMSAFNQLYPSVVHMSQHPSHKTARRDSNYPIG